MAYHEDEQVRIKRRSSNHAVTLAMEGRWREAVAVNRDILEKFPHDIDALNRLGRAYMELLEHSSAKEAYSRAVELDPYNNIAQKNLQRMSQLQEIPADLASDSRKAEPENFIEETGKAGFENLINLASKEILARIVAGDKVYLRIEGASLIVANSWGEYLGRVENKHGQRLAKFIRAGNKYSAAIVSTSENEVKIIIREVYQVPSLAGRPSFPPKVSEKHNHNVGGKINRDEMFEEEETVRERGTVSHEEEVESMIGKSNCGSNKPVENKK